MATLTLRLSDNLDRQLTVLAAQTQQNRSELVRTALEKFLRDQERKQLMDALVSEAKAAYADEAVRREAREIAEEFLPLDNEALDLAEGRKPGDPEPEKWWK
jgi:predicted transcriptional regulator